MATLTSQQLKDSYQSLVTIGDSITSNPTSGVLENGLGNPITRLGIGTSTEDWSSIFDVLRVGKTASLFSYDSIADGVFLGSNVYFDTTLSEYAYISTDPATLYQGINGDHIFNTAPSGTADAQVTFTERMRIDSVGDISFRDTSSNEAFYWDADVARLGLGNTSPSAGLHVESSDANVAYFIRPSSGPSVRIGSSTTDNAVIGYTVSGDFARFGHDSATNAIAVNSSGNVGINNTSPSSYPIAPNLVVDAGTNGGITVKSGSSNYGGVYFADGTTGNEQYRGYVQYNHNHAGSTDSLLFGTSGTERLLIDSSGNVGIGTTSIRNDANYVALQIGSTSTPASQLVLEDNASNGPWRIIGNGDLIISDDASEAMRIDSSGNVGISETNPTAPLQIKTATSAGNPKVAQFLTHADTTSGTEVRLAFAAHTNTDIATDRYSYISALNTSGSNGQALVFATNAAGAGGAERMRIDSSGNAGINYSNAAIHTYGSGVFGGKTVIKASSDNALALLNSSTGGSAQVGINFTNEFTTSQYNYLARIVAIPTQDWTSTASTRDSDLAFFTTLNGVTAEKMRILSGGGITFNGDTATDNALDDYEEGTWTMGISFNDASVGATYGENTGKYTKIGNKVTVTGRLTLTSKGTSTGIAKLFGLPFTVPDNNESQTTASIWLSGVSFANQYQTRIQTGTQKLIFGEITEAGVQTNMDNTNFSDTSTVRISMTYLV